MGYYNLRMYYLSYQTPNNPKYREIRFYFSEKHPDEIGATMKCWRGSEKAFEVECAETEQTFGPFEDLTGASNPPYSFGQRSELAEEIGNEYMLGNISEAEMIGMYRDLGVRMPRSEQVARSRGDFVLGG